MKKTWKLFLLPLIALISVIVACNKSDSAATVEEAMDEALYSLQERGGIGRYGCYELVFPVSITLPDGTVVAVDSYDQLKTAVRRYFDGNERPRRHRQLFQFVFPVSVISQDGEVITLDDQEQLLRLREACAGTFDNHDARGHGHHGLSCFEIIFPITIAFPDGTTATAADRHALRELLHTWRQANPGATVRPRMEFPISVRMREDSSVVTVNSKEELRALKENCD